jgi:hypothetical protein
VGNKELSLEKILKDLKKGKDHLRSELAKVKDKDLAKEMEWFMGEKTRGFYLMLGVSEIIHACALDFSSGWVNYGNETVTGMKNDQSVSDYPS